MGADRGSFEAKVLVAAPVASWLTPLVAVPDAARRRVPGLEQGNQPHPERYDARHQNRGDHEDDEQLPVTQRPAVPIIVRRISVMTAQFSHRPARSAAPAGCWRPLCVSFTIWILPQRSQVIRMNHDGNALNGSARRKSWMVFEA